jgi:malate synthase
VIKAISNNQFARAEEVRDLPKVLNDKVAKREFFDEQASFKEAFEITKDRHPEFDNAFYNQIIKTTKILKECTMTRIEEIKDDRKKLYYVRMLLKVTEKLCKKLGIE